MAEATLILLTILLAYSNGANDNFKGVATLYGSGVLNYRRARLLSTIATIAGALAAVVLAETLLKAFSGRGLVPGSVVADPAFAASVTIAAGATVALATRFSMPISTTHALVGGLVGAGVVAAGDGLNLGALTQQFLAPLLLGPIIAFAASALLAALQRKVWPSQSANNNEVCACVDVSPTSTAEALAPAFAATAIPGAPSKAIPHIQLSVGTTQGECAPQANRASAIVVTPSRALDIAHIVSGTSVCFARGLNDAPKIAALLLVAKSVGGSMSIGWVALAMALGGWLHSRRIAETMSHKITQLEPKGSFLANICTSVLVISASKYGFPLSATHVSVGAISGLTVGSGGSTLSATTLKHILLSWVATLPCAALIGLLAFSTLSTLSTFF